MSWVTAKPNESFESLMKRFKKAVERAGILADYKKSEYFEKPSVKRKRKMAAARKRALKRQKKMARFKAQSGTGQNFRWNKDHTKKLPLAPPKKKPDYKKNFSNKKGFTNKKNFTGKKNFSKSNKPTDKGKKQ